MANEHYTDILTSESGTPANVINPRLASLNDGIVANEAAVTTAQAAANAAQADATAAQAASTAATTAASAAQTDATDALAAAGDAESAASAAQAAAVAAQTLASESDETASGASTKATNAESVAHLALSQAGNGLKTANRAISSIATEVARAKRAETRNYESVERVTAKASLSERQIASIEAILSAASGNQRTLDQRLDAIIAGAATINVTGGNFATNTVGIRPSGGSALTVVDPTGIVAGAPISYTLSDADGTTESNIVASVNGQVITLEQPTRGDVNDNSLVQVYDKYTYERMESIQAIPAVARGQALVVAGAASATLTTPVGVELRGNFAIYGAGLPTAEIGFFNSAGDFEPTTGTFANTQVKNAVVHPLPDLKIAPWLFGASPNATAAANLVACQAAIDAAYLAGGEYAHIDDGEFDRYTSFTGGTVIHSGGELQISGTLILKSGVRFEMAGGATVSATTNDNVFHMRKNSQLVGGKIDVRRVAAFTSDAIYMNGEDIFTIRNSTLVRDVRIWGGNSVAGSPVTTTLSPGNAIHLYTGDERNHNITFVKFFNIHIDNFENGVFLEAVAPPDLGNPTDQAWINGNVFDLMVFNQCDTHYRLEAEIVSGSNKGVINRNMFITTQFEAAHATTHAIYCDGASGNQWLGGIEVWDAVEDNVITFTANSRDNVVMGKWYANHWNDENGNNRGINLNGSLPVDDRVMIFTGSQYSDSYTPEDDVLAFADSIHTVTVTGTAPTNADYAFNPTRGRYANIGSIATPTVYTIALDQPMDIRAINVLFGNARPAENCRIEISDGGSTWETIKDQTSSVAHSVTGWTSPENVAVLGVTATHIRVTVSGSLNGFATIALERIQAFATDAEGTVQRGAMLVENYEIAGGEITIKSAAQHVVITVDTEGGASSDNLDTINGGRDGQVLSVSTLSSNRDVNLTAAGNIKRGGGGNLQLTSAFDAAMLVRRTIGSTVYWLRMGVQDNG